MPHWSESYIGLPFAEKGRTREGLDCWGLVRLVLAEQCGIELPGYDADYACVAEVREIAAALGKAQASADWLPVLPGSERVFDVALFRRGRLEGHVGVIVERGRVLHVARGRAAAIERLSAAHLVSVHVGTFRHAGLADRVVA
ncbi:NlpC/P60 family protein [Methylobrevis pamukkalensis]|uniref:NlpC/P60 family protein n=1 Tax=Methylobrevis pamukkalensis TaxID=1439726 RepID=A0A1E3GWY0_9HYPH|nr:NlpC/P60 family protein [Methylobrevis pamukkalensis]ODN68543.1 NlpC/P60 family protein [Methylobrevis pamukkalensis]